MDRFMCTFLYFSSFVFLHVKVMCKETQRPVPPHPPYYNKGSFLPSFNLSKGAQPFSNISPITCPSEETFPRGTFTRNGMMDIKYRWTSFNLHLDEAYDSYEQSNINDAMWTISKLIPCVPFGIWPSNSTPTGDYVYVVKGVSNGCNSYAGRQGGKQIMNLQSPGCMHIGTITHELLHALGFHHEHGRPDRDDYINIQWENVEPGLEHAFQKYSPEVVTSFDVPYNIESIMHYDNRAFSKNGQPTITARNGIASEIMGSLELQDSDIEKLQRMYGCSPEER